MASNFNDIEIVSVKGRIQNIKEIINELNTKPILDGDVRTLESLANKLANDNICDNQFENEEALVDVLHEKLLLYYINTYNFNLEHIIDTIKVFNKKIKDINQIKYDGLLYLIADYREDIDVVSIDDEKKFIDVVSKNPSTFVKGNIKAIFNLLKNNLTSIDFNQSLDNEVKAYANTFNINYQIFYGKDQNNNRLFKIKNGLIVKTKDGLNTLLQPTFEDMENTHKVVEVKKNYQEFDLRDFIHLRNRVLNQVEMTDDEQARFYYEVRFLINTMSRRSDLKEDPMKDALGEYMNPLVNIYNTSQDVLSENDQRNVIDYLNNKKKISNYDKTTRKVA